MADPASTNTAGIPLTWISPAPRSGPTKIPTRMLPPSVESARARFWVGTTSIMNPCLACMNADQSIATQSDRYAQHDDGPGAGGQQHGGRVHTTGDDQRASFAYPGDDRT